MAKWQKEKPWEGLVILGFNDLTVSCHVKSEAWLLEDDHFDQTVTEAAGFVVGIVCLSMACAAIRLNRGWKSQGGLSWIGTSKRPDMTLWPLANSHTVWPAKQPKRGRWAKDVVLYVWVDDAFVRHHKKLVQVHYFVEIVTRHWLVEAMFAQTSRCLGQGFTYPRYPRQIWTDYQTFLFPPPYALVISSARRSAPRSWLTVGDHRSLFRMLEYGIF